ncbi:MAG TPA: hypothetical protein VGJ04_00260 [Pirellulales bacterium]
MAENFWAITTYFNPMHWQRRLANYRVFHRHLRVPLVAVELGYDGCFDLQPGDADILIQIPGKDVMWQKERLMNLALAAVPSSIERVACLDSDVILDRADVWQEASRVLEQTSFAQLYSHAFYLQADPPSDRELIQQSLAPSMSFVSMRRAGHSALDLCNPCWSNPGDTPPVTYGLAWAFRRELFANRGFYDAWIIGGGTRVHFFAGDGYWREAADAFQFHPAMRAHYRHWVRGFHAEVRGNWGCVPGAIAHLWHGDMARRRHRQRYQDFAQFAFDPSTDLALDENGVWRWNSNKPQMHQYLREYFASRDEDRAVVKQTESSLAVRAEFAA